MELALDAAATFASYATSGGEGTARMVLVKEIRNELEALRSKRRA